MAAVASAPVVLVGHPVGQPPKHLAGKSDEDSEDALLITDEITEEMVHEEHELAHEADEEEEKLWQEEQKAAEGPTAEQRFSRLKHLLDKSSLYADFLFNRMKEQEAERLAKSTRGKKKKPAKENTQAKKRTKGDTDVILADILTEDDFRGPRSEPVTGEEVGEAESAAAPLATATAAEKDTYSRKLADGRAISDRQPALIVGAVLREYQLVGVEWLKALFENGLNGILADEMGLGKTIQVISFLAHLYDMRVRGPYLIVTPLSTLSNWMSELKRFAPALPAVLYHGTPEERAQKREKFTQARKSAVGFPVVVTSFEVVMKDRRFLANIPWKYLVVDEGHRIKNLNCRLIKVLKSLQTANRLLLTGTPLQNNLAELWSLLNFLLPDIFDDLDSFQRWFDFAPDDELLAKEEEQHILTKLHQVLKPFLLRRLKTDVELSIPPKKEVILYATLTAKQEQDYKAVLNRTILDEIAARNTHQLRADEASKAVLMRHRSAKVDYREVEDDEFFKNMHAAKAPAPSRRNSEPVYSTADVHVRLQNILMQLRKVCNHPYLVEYPLTPAGDYLMDEGLVVHSGKMQLLDRVLPRLRAEGHKVLIFSQMTRMLDVLQDYCYIRDYEFVRLDGAMSFPDRQANIEKFNEDPNTFIFLLSTRAGGLGLNLTAADTVIIYDQDWNPQADLQAQDRCHRIGQTKPVLVLRLVTANTIEERIMQRAEGKRRLEKLVIHKGKFKGRQQEDAPLSPADLLELIGGDTRAVPISEITEAVLDAALDRSVTDSDAAAAACESDVEHSGPP
eukprot:m.169531 g.169531  ORF g.169531 m.169531 type:complete len:792 (-) comp15271_c0_seq32:998-3373(-)